MKSGLKEGYKKSVNSCVHEKQGRREFHTVITNVIYVLTFWSNCVLTKGFQFNLESRRPLVRTTTGNGLEADDHRLRMEK